MRQTEDQKRAQKVFAQIQAIKNQENEDIREEYGRRCMSFPAFVHGCGLCQAVSFYQSKSGPEGKKRAYRLYLQNLADALIKSSDIDRLAEEVRGADLSKYQHLTREAMALGNWYKRYAEALLGVEPGDGEN